MHIGAIVLRPSGSATTHTNSRDRSARPCHTRAMSEHDFSALTSVERKSETEFSLQIPTGWEQGRGTFGGAVIGAMARAAMASEPDAARKVRAVSAEIVGAVPSGELTLTVRTLRRGNGLSAYEVLLRARGEEVFAHGSFTLASARSSDRDFVALDAPTIPAIESATLAPVGPPMGPVFTQHIRFWPTGPYPFSGGKDATCEGFVELKEHSSWGPPEWLALADCYWPSVLALESAPRPVVTVGFACHLFTEPPPGPLFFRARSLASSEGFVSEHRELWTRGGKLVAINPQLFTIV